MRFPPTAFRATVRCLAISSVSWAIAAVAAPEGLTTFKNPEYGYSVDYPSDWHPQIHEGVFYMRIFRRRRQFVPFASRPAALGYAFSRRRKWRRAGLGLILRMWHRW